MYIKPSLCYLIERLFILTMAILNKQLLQMKLFVDEKIYLSYFANVCTRSA